MGQEVPARFRHESLKGIVAGYLETRSALLGLDIRTHRVSLSVTLKSSVQIARHCRNSQVACSHIAGLEPGSVVRALGPCLRLDQSDKTDQAGVAPSVSKVHYGSKFR
jgi:hypothetical protein